MKYAKEFLKSIIPTISDDSLELALSNIKIKKLKKGEKIATLGSTPENFYILRAGIAREYIIDKTGREYIKTLYLPPSTCGALTSLINKQPSDSIYDCITECELIVFNYNHFKKLASEHMDLAMLNVKVLERIFLRTNERVNDLTLLDGTERYLKLKKSIPNIDNLIQQYHIASYLNVTPVQLSRIRKKIYSK